MTTSTTLLEQTIKIAQTLTESIVPVVLLVPGLKKPLTTKPKNEDEEPTWLTSDDQYEVEDAIERYHKTTGRVPNLGALLSPKMGSQIICIDVDGPDLAVREKLASLDVSRQEQVWRQVTGKRNGHIHIFYQWSGDPLPRIANKPDGLDVDCLSNGYAVVAPSDTSDEPDGGGSYAWMKDHSPFDIDILDLEPPPNALIGWWLERASLAQKPTAPGQLEVSAPKAWRLITEPISQGGRNETLCKIAGWLRLYHPAPVLEELLLAINDGRCNPPLDEHEVRNIARSVGKYPQPGVNGHPKAIVNPFKELAQ